MGHENRSRVTVDQNGDWRMYTNTLPENAELLGVVTRGAKNVGALVRMEKGTYAQVNDGSVTALDGRKIASALGLKSGGGRKSEIEGGKRVTVYLTEEIIARAKEIGQGNLSEGIRVALLKVRKGKKLVQCSVICCGHLTKDLRPINLPAPPVSVNGRLETW